MAKIHKLTKGGQTIYPATTTDAVVHPTTRKNLTEELSGLSNYKILECNTDVATTRKQVLKKERKIGMKISYNDPENGWINELFTGSALDDLTWSNDRNWIESLGKNDNYSVNASDYADGVKEAYLNLLKSGQKQFNLFYFSSKYKNISFIQVFGTAEADGTLIISYNAKEYRYPIITGETGDEIASKIIDITEATIIVFDNLIKLECKVGGTNPATTAKFENSIKGLRVACANQNVDRAFNPYVGYKLDDRYIGGTDIRYYDSVKERAIERANPSFIQSIVLNESESVTIDEDGTVKWYCKNLIRDYKGNYVTSRDYEWVVRVGYVLGYKCLVSFNKTISLVIDIIRIADYADYKYSFVPILFNFRKGTYTGYVIDEIEKRNESLKPKGYGIKSGYIQYEKNLSDGSVKIINHETASYIKEVRVIYDGIKDRTNEKYSIVWKEFTIPKHGVLVYDFTKGIISVKESLHNMFTNYKTLSTEVVLLINYDGNLCGGEWYPYIIAYDQYLATYPIRLTKQIGYEEIPVTRRGYHDCTFIDGQFWTFDKADDGGYLGILDAEDFSQIKTGKTDFRDATGFKLEHKSVDYNQINKVLAIGNGSSRSVSGNSHIYLFYEFLSWPDKGETINFNNCGKYVDVDVSELGVKSYGFWAGADDMMYISINKFEDIYLIQLGKGTNNLGSGKYSYIDNETFNGTFKVVKGWHQDRYKEYGAHGGQYYNGNLYIADNHTGYCQIFKMLLNDDGSLQFENINLWKYTPDGTRLQNTDIDGLAIKDGYFYAQPLVNNSGKGNRLIIKAPIPGL